MRAVFDGEAVSWINRGSLSCLQEQVRFWLTAGYVLNGGYLLRVEPFCVIRGASTEIYPGPGAAACNCYWHPNFMKMFKG